MLPDVTMSPGDKKKWGINSMIITFDVGNTSVAVCGVLNGKILFRQKCPTTLYAEERGYVPALSQMKDSNHVDEKDIEGSIISSVVTEANEKLKSAVKEVFGSDPYIIDSDSKTGIGINIKDNREVGIDRLADCTAAAHNYGYPVMVYDLGSASTMSVVDKNMDFIGGTINPGVQLSLDVLGQRCSMLPTIKAYEVKIEKTIGDDTVSNLAGGALIGTASMVDGMIGRVAAELGIPEEELTVVMTGGNGPLIHPHLMHKNVILDPELLDKGLMIIYELNKNERKD